MEAFCGRYWAFKLKLKDRGGEVCECGGLLDVYFYCDKFLSVLVKLGR